MKFFKGDKVQLINEPSCIYTIKDDCQFCSGCGFYEIEEHGIPITDGNLLELVPAKTFSSIPCGVSLYQSIMHSTKSFNIEIPGVILGVDLAKVPYCIHDLKEYFGLNERYNFCTKCSYTDRKY